MPTRTHSMKVAFGSRCQNKVRRRSSKRWSYLKAHQSLVTFVDNFDPYAEPSSPELDGTTTSPHQPSLERSHNAVWGMPDHVQRSTGGVAAHGLEALSAAASGDHYSHLRQSVPPHHSMTRRAMSCSASEIHHAGRPPTPRGGDMLPPISPPVSMTSSNNNLNFILNPSSTLSPPIDPNLQSSFEHHDSSFSTGTPGSRQMLPDAHSEASVEMEHEIAFLLRHFSEAPGQWFVITTPETNSNELIW